MTDLGRSLTVLCSLVRSSAFRLAVFTTAKFFGIIILATTATACHNNVSFTHFVVITARTCRIFPFIPFTVQ